MANQQNKTKFVNKREKRQMTKEGRSLLLSEESPFAVIEAYKSLRTNIIFSLLGDGCKCIAVTSTDRGEGKSTNSVNLAISFGQIGKKVLLIDADMRLPSVATLLGVREHPGLSDILVGEARLGKLPLHEKYSGIDVIPAGNIPPDPTRFLGSDQMRSLVGQMKERYDYIIFDLPPANTVTDALILSELIDGYLLVVKNNSTQKREVKKMVERFELVGGKILGFLYVNAAVQTKGYKYAYAYQYGYGYEKIASHGRPRLSPAEWWKKKKGNLFKKK